MQRVPKQNYKHTIKIQEQTEIQNLEYWGFH